MKGKIKICGNCLCSEFDNKKFTNNDYAKNQLKKHFNLEETSDICNDCFPILKLRKDNEKVESKEPSKTLSEHLISRRLENIKTPKKLRRR